MFRFLLVALLVAITSGFGFMAPMMSSKLQVSKVAMNGGKGFSEDAAKKAWLDKLNQPTWGATSYAAPQYTPAGSAPSAAPGRAGRIVPASKSRVPKPAAGTWDEYTMDNHLNPIF